MRETIELNFLNAYGDDCQPNAMPRKVAISPQTCEELCRHTHQAGN